MSRRLPAPGELADRWGLDPEVVYLNHGSFGATPRAVLAAQNDVRTMLEAGPVRFFEDHYPAALDDARRALAAFVGARPEDLAFVCNATTGVNTVLRGLRLEPGDELLTTDHEYNACRNSLEAAAGEVGAVVKVARVPFPVASGDEVVDRVLDRVSSRTRLLLVDHVTSQTALVMPVASLVREAQGAGVDVLVDGAHAPGMVPLALDALGAAYYTGNCHKWLCAPKGAAFLHVREDRRDQVRPLVISHGANALEGARSRFHLEHDWTGTRDPSAWLAVPAALSTMERMLPGGWPELQRRNRELALAARRALCASLGVDPPCPEDMIGSMAAVPLPDARLAGPVDAFSRSPLQAALYREHRIEVPVIPWPGAPRRLLRISAQLYNSLEQAQYLTRALAAELAAEG